MCFTECSFRKRRNMPLDVTRLRGLRIIAWLRHRKNKSLCEYYERTLSFTIGSMTLFREMLNNLVFKNRDDLKVNYVGDEQKCTSNLSFLSFVEGHEDLFKLVSPARRTFLYDDVFKHI